MPFLNTSFDTDLAGLGYNKSVASQFRVLSTYSPNGIRLQAVEIKGAKLIKTPLQTFIIDEGKISGFDMHPSGDYLLVTSNKGRIFVYRLDTGELRGTISIPLHSRGCLVDPSGLYVAVVAPPFEYRHTVNLMKDREQEDYLD